MGSEMCIRDRYKESLVSGGLHWAKDYHWESEDGDRLRGCAFSGWYDIDELIRATEKVERYEKALRKAFEALAPFAFFADQFERKPLYKVANEFYGIHFGTEWEASLSHSQTRAARSARENIQEALNARP